MSDANIIEMIKRKEEERDLALSRAEEDYKKAILDAKKKAAATVEKAKIRASADYEGIRAKESRALSETLERIEADGRDLISSIEPLTKSEALEIFKSVIKKKFGV